MWYYILAFVVLVISVVVDIIAEQKGKRWSDWTFGFGVLAGALLLSGMLSERLEEPRAIDVYQGKTTIQYTYKDGIAVDSIVVFKNE